MLPSGPEVIAYGAPTLAGSPNSVIVPEGVMRPTLRWPASTNHRLPSAPAAMPTRLACPQSRHDEPCPMALGTVNSTTPPDATLGGEGLGFVERLGVGLPVQARATTRHSATAALISFLTCPRRRGLRVLRKLPTTEQELVEAAGVEPASEAASLRISTSVFRILFLLGGSS